MKRIFNKARDVFPKIGNTLRTYWRKLMASKHNKMSEGAQNLDKIITRPRGDSWRRHEHGKK